MANSVRWTVKVSKDTDLSLRTFLVRRGGRKGDLSKFIEDAVRWRVLGLTVAAAKLRNANVPPREIMAAVNEALAVVRAGRFASRRR